MQEVKPWYLSKGVWGGIVAMVAAVLAPIFGVSLDVETQVNITNILVSLSGVVGGALSVYGRVKAQVKISKNKEREPEE